MKTIKLNTKQKLLISNSSLLLCVEIVIPSVSPHVSEAEPPDVNNGALTSQRRTKLEITFCSYFVRRILNVTKYELTQLTNWRFKTERRRSSALQIGTQTTSGFFQIEKWLAEHNVSLCAPKVCEEVLESTINSLKAR